MHVTFKWCRWPTYIERQYPGATGLNKSNGLNKQLLSAKIEKEYFRVIRNPTARTPQDMDGTLTLIFAKSETP